LTGRHEIMKYGKKAGKGRRDAGNFDGITEFSELTEFFRRGGRTKFQILEGGAEVAVGDGRWDL